MVEQRSSDPKVFPEGSAERELEENAALKARIDARIARTSNPQCKRCGGPTGPGSNHEEDPCMEIYISRLEAEIERLRSDEAAASKLAATLLTENERLRAALEGIVSEAHKLQSGIDAALGMNHIAREALRAADETSANRWQPYTERDQDGVDGRKHFMWCLHIVEGGLKPCDCRDAVKT